jgi:hypothetical protein
MTDYLVVYTTKNEFYQNENDTSDHYEAFLDDKEQFIQSDKPITKKNLLENLLKNITVFAESYLK